VDGRAGHRRTTIAGYRQLLRIHVVPAIGDIPLQDLSALDLDALYARLHATGSPGGRGPPGNRTIRYVHMMLGKALGDAERKGLVQRNVARLATPPSPSSARSPEVTVWTPEELRAFLEFSAASPHGPLLRVAAMTGLRRSELCGLRWVDVDFEPARLTVRQAKRPSSDPPA
jgi:integrase